MVDWWSAPLGTLFSLTTHQVHSGKNHWCHQLSLCCLSVPFCHTSVLSSLFVSWLSESALEICIPGPHCPGQHTSSEVLGLGVSLVDKYPQSLIPSPSKLLGFLLWWEGLNVFWGSAEPQWTVIAQVSEIVASFIYLGLFNLPSPMSKLRARYNQKRKKTAINNKQYPNIKFKNLTHYWKPCLAICALPIQPGNWLSWPAATAHYLHLQHFFHLPSYLSWLLAAFWTCCSADQSNPCHWVDISAFLLAWLYFLFSRLSKVET